MNLNHPETALPVPWSMENLSSMKLVADAKMLGTLALKSASHMTSALEHFLFNIFFSNNL